MMTPMVKRTLLSLCVFLGALPFLGAVTAFFAAVSLYAYLYNREIDEFERQMRDAEFDVVPKEQKPIESGPEAPRLPGI